MEFLVENQSDSNAASKLVCGTLTCGQITFSNLSCKVFTSGNDTLAELKISQNRCPVFETR